MEKELSSLFGGTVARRHNRTFSTKELLTIKKTNFITIICILLIITLVGCTNQGTVNPGPEPPTDNNFDVIVLGGDPEGVLLLFQLLVMVLQSY